KSRCDFFLLCPAPHGEERPQGASRAMRPRRATPMVRDTLASLGLLTMRWIEAQKDSERHSAPSEPRRMHGPADRNGLSPFEGPRLPAPPPRGGERSGMRSCRTTPRD